MRGDTLRTSIVEAVTKPNINEAFFMARDLPSDHPEVLDRPPCRGMGAAEPGSETEPQNARRGGTFHRVAGNRTPSLSFRSLAWCAHAEKKDRLARRAATWTPAIIRR
jgi:hypothetical protein